MKRMCFKINVFLFCVLFLWCIPSFADTLSTGIIFTPTGYIKKQKGAFGGSLGFVYYIGDVVRKEKGRTDYLNPIKSFYFLSDLKVSPLKGVAMGQEGFIVLQGSQPEGSHKMSGGGDIGTQTKIFGLLYLVASKNIGRNILSLGTFYGSINRIFNPLINNVNKEIEKGDLVYFISLNTNIFKRDIGIEAIKPRGSNYLLLNTSIEKFFGFSFSALMSDDILSLIGYFGIRLNIF